MAGGISSTIAPPRPKTKPMPKTRPPVIPQRAPIKIPWEWDEPIKKTPYIPTPSVDPIGPRDPIIPKKPVTTE